MVVLYFRTSEVAGTTEGEGEGRGEGWAFVFVGKVLTVLVLFVLCSLKSLNVKDVGAILHLVATRKATAKILPGLE